MQVQTSAINQTLEQADAQTNQRDDNEHQQERGLNDLGTDSSGPTHGGGKNIANIANQGSDSDSLSRSGSLLSMNNYLDYLANEAKANKTEQVKHRGSSEKIRKSSHKLHGEIDHISHFSETPPQDEETHTGR